MSYKVIIYTAKDYLHSKDAKCETEIREFKSNFRRSAWLFFKNGIFAPLIAAVTGTFVYAIRYKDSKGNEL